MSYIVRLSLSESLTVLDNILIYIFFGFPHISPNVNDRQSNYMGLLALIPPPHNNNFISVLEALADCPWRKLANWGHHRLTWISILPSNGKPTDIRKIVRTVFH